MAMMIMNNAAAAMTLGELNKNISQVGKQLKKLSSGQRIVGAGDDASGYSISEKMRVRIRALGQDERNVQNGASLLRVAEGGIQSQIEIMRTIKEKVIDADNDTNTDLDRATIQKEIDQGYQQIQDIAWETRYNGKLLLVGDTKIEEISTWAVLDAPVTVPDSDLNIIPDNYATLDDVQGPFDAFAPYTSTVSAAAPLLGSNSSVTLAGGTDAYYDEPSEPTSATFTMDLSGYSSASDLDGVGFYSGEYYYVLTNDTSKNYKTDKGIQAREIDISGCSSVADAAQRIANANIDGTASATASGAVITFKTSGKGKGANTTTPPITGWSAAAGDVSGSTGGSSATRGRDAADPTGTGGGTTRGQNEVSHQEQVLVTPAGKDSNDVWHDAVYDYVKVVDSAATPATVTKNISGAPNNSGIVVNNAYIRFVDGSSGITRQADGTYTVGKNATVSNFRLYSWNNTIGSGGNDTGVTFSLSGGQMTLQTTGVGSSAYVAITDGFSAVAPQAAVSPTPTTTHYETVTALNSGTVSNAEGAVDRGTYHPAKYAAYDIDLTSYKTTDTDTLNEFIGELKGKTISLNNGSGNSYATYEFVDTGVPSSMDAVQQTSSSAVDLNALRTAVAGGKTIADAFIALMKGKSTSYFSDASSGDTKTLRVTAGTSGTAGNSHTIKISEGTLSQYTIDFGDFFQGNGSSLSIPEDLNDKGFRIYCATCDDQWFNFQFSLGGDLDAARPASGSSGADLKTTIINVSEVTDVESLVKAFYDQAYPAMEAIGHTLHVAADPKAGTVTFYDHRMYDPRTRPDWHPNAKEQGAKIADGVMDDVVKVKRGVYVKDLVIQHTDHASQNIHLRIPQTTLDHIFNYIEGSSGGISNYNVLTAESREMLLGNQAGKKRGGGIAPEDEKGAIDRALEYLTDAITLVGAQNMRLGMTESNIVVQQENTTASESTIRDADMAKEMAEYMKANVLSQASQSMLAQANQNGSAILSLLQ